MNRPTLGSLLLASADPSRLRAWYVQAFAPGHTGDDFLIFAGAAMLVDQRDDVAERTVEPGRVILNFHVDDAAATARHLDELGVTWVSALEERDPGMFFGTVLDPDGNYVQIIELSDEYLASTPQPFAFSGFAVDELAPAKAFYRDVLGFRVTEANGLMRLHLPSGADVLVYPKPDHVPASFTILNLPVDDIDAAVDRLAGLGVAFLRYDGAPQDARGIMRGISAGRGPDIAWFNDPAGNILAVLHAG